MAIDSGKVLLHCESARVSVDPGRGGAIRRFVWRGLDVLRPTAEDAGDDPLDMACFPMVPYVNRIAGGSFEFQGRRVRLERNWSGDAHPLHGQGWRASWQTVAASDTAATLRFEGGSDEWPWPYRAEQRIELRADALSVELSIENVGDSPMPAMLGLHPYFGDVSHARLQARLPRIWLTDAAAIPVEEAATPARCHFEEFRAVESVDLDHCFAGWDGLAMVRWPDRGVTLSASECGFLHVYAPAGRDFFCIEPQSAPPGALGRSRGEARIIGPGERFAIRVQFTVGEG